MIPGLARLLGPIARHDLPEAEIYARERNYAARARAPSRPGVLECPVCGTRATRFLRFGLDGRRNAQCPGCGSVERHRFLWLYLVRRTRLLHRRLRVLHTAPEPCMEERLRALPHLHHVGVDRFSPFADIRADLTDLPLADARFDLLLSSHVLEHVPDDRRAMAELARVLKPGARAIILVPMDPGRAVTLEGGHVASPAERLRRFGHPYHYRIYGRDVLDRLAAAGLTARLVDSRRAFAPHVRRRFRINRNHLLDCRRTA